MATNTQLDFLDELAEASGIPVRDPKVLTTSATEQNSSGKNYPRVVDQHPAGQTCSERNRDNEFRKTARRRLSARERVLECIRMQGAHGATREEIAELTGLKVSSVCGRVAELLKPSPPERPQIKQNGTKRKGPHRGSGEQVVLYAVEVLS